MKIILIILFLIKSSIVFSIDTVSIKYFPLSIGNIYVIYFWNNTNSGRLRRIINQEKVVNEKKYYLYNGSWLRTDTITGSLYSYYPGSGCNHPNGNDYLEDSLSLHKGGQYYCQANIFCNDSGSTMVFGELRSFKHFSHNFTTGYSQTKYAFGIGIINQSSGGHGFYGGEQLLGCVLNGVVYGDTSFYPTPLVQLGSSVPSDFQISQNFPNPFNPKTKINFNLPKASFVVLKIYDIKGLEIKTLVNESLKAGYYETQFDGSNIASGIYFYRIEAGNFVVSKKMVLVK